MFSLSTAVSRRSGPRSREHPIEAAARAELVQLAYAELVPSTLAGTAAAAAFAIATAVAYRSSLLWSWLAAMLLLAGYRSWLASGFKRRPPRDDAPWAMRLVVATTATALSWGLTAWLFPTLTVGGPAGVVHTLLLTGITTASTRFLLPMRKGSLLYLGAVMGPVAARFFAEADVAGAALGGCTLVFVAYMARATLRNHRTFSDAVVMRFEREALATELTAENARREAREAELREARERAESASRAKGDFLATISHEIRTPMNGVLGMLRVLQDTPLERTQRGYVKTASDSAESLLLLLNDVLDFSKIEAGRLELENAAFAPQTPVAAVADLMRARAHDKGLQFETDLTDLPPIVLGDATRLRQILLNLVGNAIKFTAQGSVVLTARGIERTADRALIRFSVTDTGIGIGPGALDRLFQPFVQVDASMSRRYGGTGLGLAISQRIAQAMGGKIEVESTPDLGSTFRLTLPFALPTAAAPAAGTTAPFVVPRLSGRVLVVEDDCVNQQVVELFLKKLGLNPAMAADGEAAIIAVSREPFDVVLMDCQLPGIDGLEATRRIRQLPGGSDPRIIALTANANTDVRAACLAAGMNDFLSKPVRFELLAEVLQRSLANRRA